MGKLVIEILELKWRHAYKMNDPSNIRGSSNPNSMVHLSLSMSK